MFYCCEDCDFLFQRVGEIGECPLCEGHHLRPATEEEIERLQSLLKKREENKEEAGT